MNRVERLTAILLLLQGGKRSAGDIAQHFEVSRRTIQRDIDALCEMGIPIGAEIGVAGGYFLPADYSLPPLALTLHEALLLRLALSSLSKLSETPFKPERESLLNKVQTLLPLREREVLEQFAQPLTFDIPSRPYSTPFLDDLLESARQKQWLAVTYCSERGISQQTILPRQVRSESGLWYCEAYSFERGNARIYRVDRFQNMKAVSPPAQVDDAHEPIAHTDPSFPEVEVQLTTRGVLRMERETYLAPHVQRQQSGEGCLRIRLHPEEYDWLMRVLLSLGTDAHVIAPETLRTRMREEVLAIARFYSEL